MVSLTEISLTKPSFFNTVKKQYLYKLKSRTGMFITLIIAQAMGLLFSLSGIRIYSTGSEGMNVTVSYFSSDLIIWFTCFWIFASAVLITNKEHQNIDFTFVSDRLSSNLSNVGFLVTAALIGAITAMLSGYLLRIVIYLTYGSDYLLSRNFIVAPELLLTGIAVTLLYLLFFSALGYLVGSLVQFNRIFAVLLSGAFLGFIFFAGRGDHLSEVIFKVINFFRGESSLDLLAVKIILTVGLFYACSFVLSNRLEVR